MKLYLIFQSEHNAKSGTAEGVFFQDQRDAEYTRTGDSGYLEFSNVVPSIGKALREWKEPDEQLYTLEIFTGALEEAFNDVREFHLAFGHPAPEKPTLQPLEQAKRRAAWIESECRELVRASEKSDIVGQVDAYFDALYFALGGLVEMGVEPSEIFAAGHAANMRKLWADGKPRWKSDGKVQKPEGWTGPEADIAAEIERQQNA